jgi:hypothetical protein
MNTTRLFVYPKDVSLMTGRTERQSRNSIYKIKKYYNKKPHQLLTVKEYCEYMGIDEKEVRPFLI